MHSTELIASCEPTSDTYDREGLDGIIYNLFMTYLNAVSYTRQVSHELHIIPSELQQ